MTAEGGALPLQAVHASVQELAQAHARAMTSELQLVMMEKDYAAVKWPEGEVAALSAGLQKERAAAQAAQEKSQAAVEQLRKMELQYMHTLEELDHQLRVERVRKLHHAGKVHRLMHYARAICCAAGLPSLVSWPPSQLSSDGLKRILMHCPHAQRWKLEAQQSRLQAPHQTPVQRSSLPPPPLLPCAPQSSPQGPICDHDVGINSGSKHSGSALQVAVDEEGDGANGSELACNSVLLPEVAALLDLRHKLL
eukprot:scaffold28763_cov15-Tisochrysis_lutea.AAC.1